jgi:putative MATE family efflux protein
MEMMYKLIAGFYSTAQLKKLKHLWKDVLEAIRGSEQNFTEGSIGRAILLLSIPMVLEMIMESVFAFVDMVFVTRLGAEAVAVVGLTEAMITLIYAIGMGMSMGTTALVARRIGEKNPDKAAVAAVQAILAGIFFSMLLAIPGWFMSKQLLQMMGASSSAIAEGYRYTMIIIGTNAVIMLLFIINAIFRSAGDAAIAMRILLIANGLNIILDPIFIFGWGPIPAMGITGAAIATAIGRGIAVIIQLWLLTSKSKGRIKVELKHIVLRWKALWSLLKISSGGMLQNIIATASWVGLVRILATFGDEVIAGYTIAIRIVVLIILPSFGMSNAAATLVGQNLGAQQPLRAEKSVWTTGYLNMAFFGTYFNYFY